jgi:hypothetical protein
MNVAGITRWPWPVSTPRSRRAGAAEGVPRVDAIELYIENTGWLPTAAELNPSRLSLTSPSSRAGTSRAWQRYRDAGVSVASHLRHTPKLERL